MNNFKTYLFGMGLLMLPLFGQAQEVEQFLRIAEENQPEISAAYTEFEAALQKSPQVASLPDPTLTVSAFGQMMETRLGSQEARFSLMQMFPWFGTLEARGTVADLQAESKFQQYLQAREKVFVKIKNKYAEIYALEETLELQQRNLDILESYRKLALNRFEAGSAPMVNVVKVDIRKDELETEIELMQDELDTKKAQFNYLLNRNPYQNVEVADTLKIATIERDSIQLHSHPELEMYSRQMQVYEAEEELSRLNASPMLGVGVDYSIISKREDANPKNNGRDAIMPMVSVSLPIFRGRYTAQREEARLMRTAVENNRQAVENQLQSEFEMIKFQLKKAKKLMALYDRQLENSGQANKLLISGFSNSTTDFEEVLTMNQDILMLRIQKVQTLADAYKAAAQLDYLTFKSTTNEAE